VNFKLTCPKCPASYPAFSTTRALSSHSRKYHSSALNCDKIANDLLRKIVAKFYASGSMIPDPLVSNLQSLKFPKAQLKLKLKCICKSKRNNSEEICNERFSSCQGFFIHQKKKHKEENRSNQCPVATCQEFSRDFGNIENLKYHLNNVHNYKAI
jgi:hypothetical protein